MPPKTTLLLSNLPPPFLLPRLPLSLHNALAQPPRQQTRSIRSISPPKRSRSRFTNHPSSAPVPLSHPSQAAKRKAFTLLPRTGALGIKKGMSAIFEPKTGRRSAVTIIQLDRNQVVAHKTPRRDGYAAVQMGHGFRLASNVSRAMKGHYSAAGTSAKTDLVEFRVRDEEALALTPVGKMVGAGWFRVGQFVDARAKSHGKGFAGGMKRHGFAGQPASHGNSLSHRAMGSAGQGQGGGSRVLPGKKMPGRMGGQRVTVQNLRVVRVDEPAGLVVVNGCVGGPKGCLVQLSDAIKKPWPNLSFLAAADTPRLETATA